MSKYRITSGYNRGTFLVILFVMFGMFAVKSFAQEASSTSESSIAEEAQKRGITQDQMDSVGIDPSNPEQAIQRARELGIPESEIQNALQEQSSMPIESDQETVTEQIESEVVESPDITVVIEEMIVDEAVLPTEDILNRRFADLSYYGYDIFQRGRTGTVESPISPIDPGYIISSGDVLRLILWGEVDFQYELNVDDKGTIIVPQIGPIFVSGIRYEKLKETLNNLLSRFYSGLVNDPPTIFMDVSLAQLRSTQIYVMGEVANPGTFSLSSYGTTFDALYEIGGPNTSGSLRDIRIIRDGKVESNIDFYDYLLKGISNDDERLQYNDIVFIPPRKISVGIKGEILRPSIYELKDGESLADLINFAGGYKSTAYAFRAQIDRIEPLFMREKGATERVLLDVDLSEMQKQNKTIPLYDGDIITIFHIIDETFNYVDIFGAGVLRPGRYELNESLTSLKDLIDKSDGLTSDVYLPKADLIRLNDDLKEVYYEINLEEIMNELTQVDLLLQKRDRIRIYSKNEMISDATLSLEGFVAIPGRYSIAQNTTLYDLLFTFSGLQDSTRYSRTLLDRGDIYRIGEDGQTSYILPFNVEDVWSNKSSENIPLMNNDSIVLYEKTIAQYSDRIVNIEGFVENPGEYTWKSNMTLADLILESGGFSYGAWIYDAEVARFPTEGIAGDSTAVIITAPIIKQTKTDVNIEDIILEAFINESEAKNFILKPQDRISIRNNENLELPKTINIEGAVLKPGNYNLATREDTVSDLIKRAGGLRDNAYLGGAQLQRFGMRVFLDFEKITFNGKKKRKEDIILLEGDRITIPEIPNSIILQGEIHNPGIYHYNKGWRASHYVYMAGGITEDANGIYIQQPTGYMEKVGVFNNPKAMDGSIITVRTKPPEVIQEEGEKIDWSQTIRDSFALMSSAMMIIYLSKQIN
ncbi:SLBB domain-containing protein [Candidatus Latescibacterota bacterium]